MIPLSRLYVDPYQTLGLRPDASEKEIRKAYRLLAMENHPDRNPDNPEAGERFKQIQWAYETLTAKKKETSMPGHPVQYGDPLAEDMHPFFNFFLTIERLKLR